MHRIDHATRLVDANGAGKDGFTGGTPDRLIPPTRVPHDWLNAIQEEIVTAIIDAGIALNKANHGQLSSAIAARVASAVNALPAVLNANAGFLNAAYAWTAQHTHAALSKFTAGLVASALRLDAGDMLYSDAAGAPVWRSRLIQVPLDVTPGVNPTVAAWYMAPGGNLASVGPAEGHIPLRMPRGARLTGLSVGVVDGGAGATITITVRKTSFNVLDGTLASTTLVGGDGTSTSNASALYQLLSIGTIPPEPVDNLTYRYRLTITAEGTGAKIHGALLRVDEAGFMGSAG